MTYTLRFDWHGAIRRLTDTPSAHPPRQVMHVAATASTFVARWADFAELVGMQPAHLLSYRDETGMGLAWRTACGWRNADLRAPAEIEVVCFPRRHRIVVDGASGIARVYGFERDGRCVLITGDEYAEIMTTPMQLEALPTVRQRSLALDIAAGT